MANKTVANRNSISPVMKAATAVSTTQTVVLIRMIVRADESEDDCFIGVS
jgi:energy-converting hydrogenase Eha subunit E